MQKPDNKIVSDVINKVLTADKQLYHIVDISETAKKEINEAVAILKLDAINEKLENTPIEELNSDKSGIKVNLLKSSGYNTIADIKDMTRAQLTAINGIGEDGAKKILGRVNEIKVSVSKYSKIHLSSDKNNRACVSAISNIDLLLLTKQYTEKALELYNAYHKGVTADINTAKELLSGLKWVFTSKEQKQQRIESYGRLYSVTQNGYTAEAQELYNGFENIYRTLTIEKCLSDFDKNTAPFYAWLEQITGSQASSDKALFGLSDDIIQSITDCELDTSLLKVVLRNYQIFGAKYIVHQKRALLGDEMGLGKTVQAISAMAHYMSKGMTHFLVVCPVSVLVNWKREIEEHSEMKAGEIYGSDRDEEYERWKKEGGVAVTTFETLVRIEADETRPADMIVVDEAHYVKNPAAQRTKALKSFTDKAQNVLFMTGTPLENKVEEMIFLIKCLRPEIARELEGMKVMAKADEFREKIAPVYLRRVREDVLTELPEKLEKEQWCRMGDEEKNAYLSALSDGNFMNIRRVSWNVGDMTKSSKAKRLMEICENAKEENRKVIVFSFFLDIINNIMDMYGDRCYGPISGAIPADKRQEIVDEFSKGESGSILVSQIIAGGVGLNIQSASVVIICEPQWKPSTENQAISRAYRMGQSRSVMVHRLLCEESIDEQMMQILKGKTEVFGSFADDSVIDEKSKGVIDSSIMAQLVEEERRKHGITENPSSDQSSSDPTESEVTAEQSSSDPTESEVPADQTSPISPPKPLQIRSKWICVCGTTNYGNFCGDCGRRSDACKEIKNGV